MLVDETPDRITVEFIDRVFMKDSHSYKAVYYRHRSLDTGFWTGYAVDKQINSGDMESPAYWIKQFLDSDFTTTAAMGTRRLSVALKHANSSTNDLSIKREIAAAATLAHGLEGTMTSVDDFCLRFGFSDETTILVKKQLSDPTISNEQFEFDPLEFSNQLKYRSIELDNGAVLTAESGEFENVFQREDIPNEENEIKISTTGKVIGERLRKGK